MADKEKDEVVETVATEEDNFLARLEKIQKGFTEGNAAQAATVTPVVEKGLQIKTGDDPKVDDDSNIDAKNVDPLRKSFDLLASSHVDMKHFGSDSAQEDPVGYLREVVTDIKGRRKYRVSDSELETAMQVLLIKGKNKEGTTYGTWKNANPVHGPNIDVSFRDGLSKGMFGKDADIVSKSLDTGSGSGGPLIRTDIDPLLRVAYLRKFPLGEQISKFPANGKVHTYDKQTAPGTAAFVSELGSLSATASDSTYVQTAMSNVGILVAQRQVSLKLQWAVAQSGMAFNLSGSANLEVISALTAIAKANQSAICQGNFTDGGKTLDDEEGLTNTAAFDGLRTILKGASSSSTKAAGDSYMRALNAAVINVINAGGDPDNLQILCSYGAKMVIEEELLNFLRVQNGTAGAFQTNLAANGILTVADTLSRLLPIPADGQGNGQGYYTYSGNAVEDLTITDPSGMGLAYLGSPTPSILELPMGYNNALSNVYIPFLMNGLCVFVAPFHRKIRIPQVTY